MFEQKWKSEKKAQTIKQYEWKYTWSMFGFPLHKFQPNTIWPFIQHLYVYAICNTRPIRRTEHLLIIIVIICMNECCVYVWNMECLKIRVFGHIQHLPAQNSHSINFGFSFNFQCVFTIVFTGWIEILLYFLFIFPSLVASTELFVVSFICVRFFSILC